MSLIALTDPKIFGKVEEALLALQFPLYVARVKFVTQRSPCQLAGRNSRLESKADMKVTHVVYLSKFLYPSGRPACHRACVRVGI